MLFHIPTIDTSLSVLFVIFIAKLNPYATQALTWPMFFLIFSSLHFSLRFIHSSFFRPTYRNTTTNYSNNSPFLPSNHPVSWLTLTTMKGPSQSPPLTSLAKRVPKIFLVDSSSSNGLLNGAAKQISSPHATKPSPNKPEEQPTKNSDLPVLQASPSRKEMDP